MNTRFTAPAARQARIADTWWRENRSLAPRLFAEELRAVRQSITEHPSIGRRFAFRGGVWVRRALTPKSGYHVYYEVDEAADVINILAVWSAVRGDGPKLV